MSFSVVLFAPVDRKVVAGVDYDGHRLRRVGPLSRRDALAFKRAVEAQCDDAVAVGLLIDEVAPVRSFVPRRRYCCGEVPLKQPGVYRFAHEASGYVYIGSSMNVSGRRRAWYDAVAAFDPRRISTRGPQSFGLSRRLSKAFTEVGSLGWRFSVIEYFPADVASATLWEAELREIVAARSAAGDRCLNTNAVKPTYLTQWDGRDGFFSAELKRRFGVGLDGD